MPLLRYSIHRILRKLKLDNNNNEAIRKHLCVMVLGFGLLGFSLYLRSRLLICYTYVY